MSADTTLLVARRIVNGDAHWTAKIVQNVEAILAGTPVARRQACATFPLNEGIWFRGEGACERARALGDLLVAELKEKLEWLECAERFALIEECADDENEAAAQAESGCDIYEGWEEPDDYEPPEERGNPVYE